MPTPLEEYLVFRRRLEEEGDADSPERAERDREIGRGLRHLTGHPILQLRAWLAAVGGAGSATGERPLSAFRLVSVILAVAGLAIGWGSAQLVFAYDGSRPINVVDVLAVFVVAQLLLLVLFVIVSLPATVAARLPGIGALADGVRHLSPGRLAPVIARILPHDLRDGLAGLVDAGPEEPQRLRLRKWLFAQLSQAFAIAFNLGAVLGGLYLVLFSDLAFGWSTTLELEASRFHALIQALASPWAQWLPAAAPSLELVETTRFFRFKEGGFPGAPSPLGTDVLTLGGWWPFLMAAIVVYGLGPRLLTWGFARWRVRAACHESILALPAARHVLEHMNAQLVETHGAPSPELSEGEGKVLARSRAVDETSADVIDWNGVFTDSEHARERLAQDLRIHALRYFSAGAGRSLDEDAETIARAAAGEAEVIVLVKAWEPPMLEFLDFLNDLRGALPAARSIGVLPVGATAADRLGVPSAGDLETWRSSVGALNDDRVAVAEVDRR